MGVNSDKPDEVQVWVSAEGQLSLPKSQVRSEAHVKVSDIDLFEKDSGYKCDIPVLMVQSAGAKRLRENGGALIRDIGAWHVFRP